MKNKIFNLQDLMFFNSHHSHCVVCIENCVLKYAFIFILIFMSSKKLNPIEN